MGWHSVFYKKIDYIPYEKIQKSVLNDYMKGLIIRQECVICHHNINHKFCKSENKKCVDSSLCGLKLLKRQSQIIKKGLCKVATINRYVESYNKNIRYPKTKYIEYSSEKDCYYSVVINDLVRIGRDVGITCYSYEETLKVIEENEDYAYTFYGELRVDYKFRPRAITAKLKRFWLKYPDGMIYFQ